MATPRLNASAYSYHFIQILLFFHKGKIDAIISTKYTMNNCILHLCGIFWWLDRSFTRQLVIWWICWLCQKAFCAHNMHNPVTVIM